MNVIMKNSIRKLLEASKYCTVATVCKDGSPWNVPVHFAFDETYIYFRSPAGTIHGANIVTNSRVSVVVFDTTQSVKGALYIHSQAQKLDDVEEQKAIEAFNGRFDRPLHQWDQTEYYRFKIGTLDTIRTKGEMYYFQDQPTI